MNDSEVIELFWQRSEDALSACDQMFGKYCRSIVRNILDNDADVDECVNDTWLRAWNTIPPSRPTHLKAFLGKISRNLALDRHEMARAQKRGRGTTEISFDELGEIQAQSMNEGEITEVISDFLRTDPIMNTDIFVRRYWYLQNIKDIANVSFPFICTRNSAPASKGL
jgi:RNA polymerase sigma-70 factor (ECF subfamily)